MQKRAACGADLTNQPPHRRGLLDETLEPPPRHRQKARRPAAPASGRAMVAQLQAQIRPFKHVTLVADGEIEAPQSELDRMSHQVAKMPLTRPVAAQLAVVIL